MAHKTAISSTKKSTVAKPADAESTSKMSFVKTLKTSIKDKQFVSGIAAEGVGTFLFTLAFLQMQSSPLYLAFAVAGVILMVKGKGALHFNPAFTIAAWVTRKINVIKVIGNILAQVIGVVAAYFVIVGFLNGSTSTASFQAAKIVEGKEWAILLAEFLGTAIFAFGFAALSKSKHSKVEAALTGGFAAMIGQYVAVTLIIVSLGLQQAANFTYMNPAIAIASKAISFSTFWPSLIYIFVPIVAAVLGYALQDLMKYKDGDCDCENCEVK